MRSIMLSALALAFVSLVAAGAQTATDRERARIQNRLGWENMRAERWAEAAQAFRKAIDADPTYEYGYYSLGRAELALKNYDDAISALNKCAGLYRAQLGRRFTNSQDLQRYRADRVTEIKEYIRELRSGPQTMQVQNQIRQLENQIRDIEESANRGTSNLSLDLSVPAYVTLSLGSAYFRAGRLSDAEREYKATVLSDPKSGEAYNNLAVVYLETERFAEAEDALKSAKKAGFKVHPQLEQDIKTRKK